MHKNSLLKFEITRFDRLVVRILVQIDQMFISSYPYTVKLVLLRGHIWDREKVAL
jgi:hypothetical protein